MRMHTCVKQTHKITCWFVFGDLVKDDLVTKTINLDD